MSAFDQKNQNVENQYNAENLHIHFGINNIDLAKQLGVAESALQNFFFMLRQKNVPIFEWDSALRKIAENYNDLLQRARSLSADDPAVLDLQQRAKDAIDVCDFDAAEVFLSQAIDLDNQAAEKFKEMYKKRKVSAAENQLLIAGSYKTRFLLHEAIGAYQLALDLSREAENDDLSSVCSFSLGLAFFECCDFDKAIDCYQVAINYFSSSDSDELKKTRLIKYYNGLSMAWSGKKDFHKAMEYAELALNGAVDVYGKKDPRVAGFFINIGLVAYENFDAERAMDYYNEALKVCNEPIGLIACFGNIGLVYLKPMRNFNKAIQFFESSLMIALPLLGIEHPRTLQIYNNLGGAWHEKKEYSKALEYYQFSLDGELKLYGEGHPNIVKCFNNIGGIFLDKGEKAKALEYFEKALAICELRLGSAHPTTLFIKQRVLLSK